MWRNVLILLSVLFVVLGLGLEASAIVSDPGSLSCADYAPKIEQDFILLAQSKPLSGSALESACQAYTQQALKDSGEWVQFNCQKKLSMSPQLFSTDSKTHLSRCKSTAGTVIDSDNKKRQEYLNKCRPAGGAAGVTSSGLSGGVSEADCQAYATRAIKDTQEWERLQCKSKLKTAPQVFSLEREKHLKRCRSTDAKTIESDDNQRDAYLKQCRSAAGQSGTTTVTPPKPPPTKDSKGLSGEWEVTITDLRSLKQNRYVYSFTFTENHFDGKYLVPKDNISKFQGDISSDGTRIQFIQTSSGYNASFAGKKVGQNKFEGGACDSRGGILSFTLKKK